MAKRTESIEFESIPGVRDGELCLSIRPPGTWFDSTNYIAFMGGCGVGHAETLKAAKKLLLDKAEAGCRRRIAEAEQAAKHWQEQLARLERDGLKPVKSGKTRG